MKVSVIIPTLNEEKNLPHVLTKLIKLTEVTEVILVDGHSKDRTVAVAKEIMPEIKIVYQRKKGKGDALKEGWNHATGDILVTLDADGSLNSDEISTFVKLLQQGYHLVKGSRFMPGGGSLDMPAHRRFGNMIFTTTANALFLARYTDLVYGYHAFHKSILEKFKLDSNGFEIDTELYIKAKKAKLKIAEVPSFEDKRLNGTSNLRSLQDGWRILKTLLRVRFSG